MFTEFGCSVTGVLLVLVVYTEVVPKPNIVSHYVITFLDDAQ